MTAEEMRALLKREPFQPLRVHLTDGRVFDIIYPELTLVTRGTFVLGIPPAVMTGPWPYAERGLHLDWENIHHVDSLPSAVSPPMSPGEIPS